MTVPPPIGAQAAGGTGSIAPAPAGPRKGASTRAVVVAAPPAGCARAPSPRLDRKLGGAGPAFRPELAPRGVRCCPAYCWMIPVSTPRRVFGHEDRVGAGTGAT